MWQEAERRLISQRNRESTMTSFLKQILLEKGPVVREAYLA